MSTLTRTARLQAMQAGRTAALAGDPVTTCPYSPNGDNTARALARAWVRTWLATRGDAGAVSYAD